MMNERPEEVENLFYYFNYDAEEAEKLKDLEENKLLESINFNISTSESTTEYQNFWGSRQSQQILLRRWRLQCIELTIIAS